jgi:hypothetical protein
MYNTQTYEKKGEIRVEENGRKVQANILVAPSVTALMSGSLFLQLTN